MRTLSGIAAACIFSITVLAADNPFVGTWKLNTEKSKGTPGTIAKEETVTFEEVGDEMKRTVKGVDGEGQPIDISATIPWDGKAHKVEGREGRPPVMVAVTSVDDNTIDVKVTSQDGKPLSTGRVVVSDDGKTMKATFKGEDPKGRKIDNVSVYDKE